MEQDRQTPSSFYQRPHGQGTEQDKQTPSPFYQKPKGQDTKEIPKKLEEPANGLARASMVLGVISIVLFFTFTIYPAVVFGSLAIILALLSRGASFELHSKAKTGIITAVVAIVGNIALLAASLYLIFGSPDYFESIYGMSYEEMIEGMQDGSLDYNELYENIYNNMHENMDETSPDDM